MDKTASRDAFIEENLRLVHSLCHRFCGRGIEYDDLYQAGCVGLVKAADAFDSSRGLCFSTYAVPVILGEVRRLFRDGGTVKVSRGLKELSLKVARLKEEMEYALGREPTVGELAEKLSVTPEDISEAICALQPVLSLTYEGDDGVAEYDLPSENNEDELCTKIMISGACSRLEPIEQRLIKLRYFEHLTQSQTAKRLDMTQVQVSRSEKKILKKLRSIIEIGA